jgi:outer membrane protein assembly factor BamB
VLDGTGLRRWAAHFGPICWDVVTGSFDGDKTRGVVCGSGAGFIRYFAADGRLRLAFNTGDEVRDVAAADLDGDGKDEVLAAGFSSNVYCFGADAKPRWHVNLGAPVAHLATVATGNGRVVVAITTDGRTATLDAAGAIRAFTTLKSAPAALVVVGGRVIVATEDGTLLSLAPLP